jgi:hypothetical protein
LLLDTYQHGGQALAVTATALGQILDRAHALVGVDDDQLLAMGAYCRLFGDWQPESLKAPSVQLRTATALAGATPWLAADSAVTVPGEHFSVVEDDAATTAAAIEHWLTEGHPRP